MGGIGRGINILGAVILVAVMSSLRVVARRLVLEGILAMRNKELRAFNFCVLGVARERDCRMGTGGNRGSVLQLSYNSARAGIVALLRRV